MTEDKEKVVRKRGGNFEVKMRDALSRFEMPDKRGVYLKFC